MKRLITVFLVAAVVSVPAPSQIDEPLKLIQTIELPGLHDGTFDHFEVDLPGQRLFLTAEDNSAVKVIDMRTNTLVHTITVPSTPHSMAYDTDLKKLFVVDETQVEIYDGESYKLSGTIPIEAHADASVYDRARTCLYVGNGGRRGPADYCCSSLAVTRHGKKIGDL